MIKTEPIQYLRDLGLNQLEAEIYVFLLPHAPMTAYKIAQSIGKPAGNVYKAVERLSRKGALIIEDGPNRICRAVSPRTFLRRAERDYRELSGAAQNALKDIELAPVDEHVCRVETLDQVYTYCREMLEKARVIAVIDAFPIPLNRISPLISDAVGRGVEVHIEAYAPIDIDGAHVVTAPLADKLVRQWSAQQLNVIVDGELSLMALLSSDGSGLLQAYWSNSLYLACLHHGGRLCEQTLLRAIQARQNDATKNEIISILDNHPFFINKPVPGQQRLNRRYSPRKERS